ncbi:NAD-dependent epimerase/dehydratase family protein [Entomomonas moraniae]|uniref:NAD-dependent epimerase/dehydratase family protein n=1 Tax=Entomomonas moraniae TaxID=2213226 RepID=A0A3S9XE58_9GAMM|nr:NAD-dependent epimerase/dehydratase family protein [Entomomonas moraniae]AZS50747.1 NAD-dependent epimerase/dehydratase family protein [Entomomonas moraniae]
MKVLITGATGFVGSAFLKKILEDYQFTPIITVREFNQTYKTLQQFIVKDLTTTIDWSEVLIGVDCIVHIAGRAHVLKETAQDPLQAFRAVNVDATLKLAKQALAAGVKRFVFISSIGVNGIHNTEPFTEDDMPNPQTDYARSKLEAEEALWQLTKDTDMELVIIRPPLVYGEQVKANFLSLLKWVYRGIPLPLGWVNNKRSFVSVDNLVDLLMIVLTHPNAANQLFLVADSETLSTTQLLKLTAKKMHKSIFLLPVPVILLKIAATILGKKNTAIQLCDSLEVSIDKANILLGWRPSISIEEGLHKTVTAFLQAQGQSCKD